MHVDSESELLRVNYAGSLSHLSIHLLIQQPLIEPIVAGTSPATNKTQALPSTAASLARVLLPRVLSVRVRESRDPGP